MKIRCDVCENGEASVFCVADEAALCSACDHRVHHANKLAGKHHRFSLLSPSPTQFPVCDICQERRAFVFCQQDRAILCRECDVPIHKSKALKHNRFLFTGIKVSPTSALYSSSSSSVEAAESSRNSVPIVSPIVSNAVPSYNSHDSANKEEIVKSPKSVNGSKGFSSEIGSIGSMNEKDTNNGSRQIISDQLVDVLSDWSVEDFIDPFSPLVFSKSGGSGSGSGCDVMPFWDCTDLHSNNNNESSFSSQKSNGDWVPQAATAAAAINPIENENNQPFSNWNMAAFGGQISFNFKQHNKDLKVNRKWNDDNSFAVPQTNPPTSSSASNKRSKPFW